ncbi:hypothetical protein Acr_16g0001150 [Actinidia rufa]|uniref:Uncharacterized protein n=1 Tax=Actinidia rufa TaxID=165716 RepID=A0A7J0FXS0_9ERIC|nr:hypothetical protein Acr_16g0001150 [Actinidia rufa]
MSSRIKLGDGELGYSLPSWVSDHLGGKSYITDEVNQSPSLPFKGSPTDNSSIYTEYPKMDTSNLTKETSVMTQGDIDKLREKYSFPPGIQLRIPGEGETILPTRPGEARPNKNLLRGSPSNVKGWKKRFFFASRDEWEFFPSMPSGEGISRVPRSWGMPGKSYNKLPVLTEDEVKRTAEVLGKIEPGGSLTCLRGPSFSSDSGSQSLSDSGLSPELRSDGWGEEGPELGDDISTTLERDRHSRKKTSRGCPQPRHKEGRSGGFKGQGGHVATPPKRTKSNKGTSNAVVRTSTSGSFSPSPGDNLGPGASMMSSAPVAWKILNGVILPADKEKFTSVIGTDLARADSTELEMVKAQNRASQAESQLASMGEQAMKTEAELKDKSDAMTRLEAEVAELTSKLVVAKKLAIEEFKSSDDFKDAVIDAVATYFDEGLSSTKGNFFISIPTSALMWRAWRWMLVWPRKRRQLRWERMKRTMKAKRSELIDLAIKMPLTRRRISELATFLWRSRRLIM